MNVTVPSIKKYDREEFLKLILESATYLMKADDAGSVDFEYVRIREYFQNSEDILTESGGI